MTTTTAVLFSVLFGLIMVYLMTLGITAIIGYNLGEDRRGIFELANKAYLILLAIVVGAIGFVAVIMLVLTAIWGSVV